MIIKLQYFKEMIAFHFDRTKKRYSPKKNVNRCPLHEGFNQIQKIVVF